jgi:hypothetical protein
MKIKIALAAFACSGTLLAFLSTSASAAPVSGISQPRSAVLANPLLQKVHRRWRRRWGWGGYGYSYAYPYYRPYYPAYRAYYYGGYGGYGGYHPYYPPPPPAPYYYYDRPYGVPYWPGPLK